MFNDRSLCSSCVGLFIFFYFLLIIFRRGFEVTLKASTWHFYFLYLFIYFLYLFRAFLVDFLCVYLFLSFYGRFLSFLICFFYVSIFCCILYLLRYLSFISIERNVVKWVVTVLLYSVIRAIYCNRQLLLLEL